MNSKPKRFGDGRAGYARHADDWYVEEERAVEALITVERFEGAIYDPACGGGTIPLVFARHGFKVRGSDLRDRGYGVGGVDFLAAPVRRVPNIVCNPPFHERIVVAFILKAIRCARRKVAMLLRSNFREGLKRYLDLFAPHPPIRVWDFKKRISMPPGHLVPRPRRGGQMAFAWFVWEPGWTGPHYQGGWL